MEIFITFSLIFSLVNNLSINLFINFSQFSFFDILFTLYSVLLVRYTPSSYFTIIRLFSLLLPFPLVNAPVFLFLLYAIIYIYIFETMGNKSLKGPQNLQTVIKKSSKCPNHQNVTNSSKGPEKVLKGLKVLKRSPQSPQKVLKRCSNSSKGPQRS